MNALARDQLRRRCPPIELTDPERLKVLSLSLSPYRVLPFWLKYKTGEWSSVAAMLTLAS